MRIKPIIFLIALICFVLGILAENNLGIVKRVKSKIASSSKEENVEKIEVKVPVRVMEVNLSDIENALDYVGDIEAKNMAEVFPKVDGKIINELKKEGDSVKKGDAIFYIDRDEIGFEYEKAPVESPIAGIIGDILVDVGDHVSPSVQVAVVADMDEVEIKLDIPEVYFPELTVGQKAKVTADAYPGRVFMGAVTKISPIIDTSTRAASVTIGIDNAAHDLKPGMYARIKLVLKRFEDVPVILKEAISGKEPNTYVYVVKDGIANKRNIKLGYREGSYFQVKEGLSRGEKVVIMGQQLLREGRAVISDEYDIEN